MLVYGTFFSDGEEHLHLYTYHHRDVGVYPEGNVL